MKTVIVTIPSAPLSQGFLRTDFLQHLTKGGDTRVVLLVPPFKHAYYAKEFVGRSEIVVESAPYDRYKRFEGIAHQFLRQSIPSTTIYNRQMHAFYSKSGLVRWLWFVSTRILWLLGHMRIWREFLRLLYTLTPYAAYLPIIDQHKPDLIFATTLFDRMDLGLMKAARKRGVRIVGMPKSWDSITSKCFTPIKPDYMLVQNQITRAESITYSDMREDRLSIVGIPQFDFYFNSSLIMPRDEWLHTINVPHEERYILFTGGGLDLFPDECDVLAMLHERMMRDDSFKHVKLVYRPHPNYGWCVDVAKDSQKIVIAESHKKVHDTSGGWEFEPEDLKFLLNSIQHADVVLHMASTIGIEVALLDRPMIGIASDGKKQKPFYLSSERYYHTNHFSPMTQSGGMKIARTVDEIMAGLRAYRENSSLDKAGRERVVREEVVYTDGKSARRIAEKLREILSV
ncbi:CDP-glycerol glycerophosphotransferase family protein [Candidatus Kaiserbacteria bacterium]|nr:CDP-glycerol glycerophosphotransferase family protein [Candidatus Kaiserbacteria bacterium]